MRSGTIGIQRERFLMKGKRLWFSLTLVALLSPPRVANAAVKFLGLDTTAALGNNYRMVTVSGSVVCNSNQSFFVSAVVQPETETLSAELRLNDGTLAGTSIWRPAYLAFL